MVEGELGTRRQARKRRKSDRLLLPEQRKITINIRPLSLLFRLGPDPAKDREAHMPTGEKAFRPFGAEEFLTDKIGQDLAGEE